MSSKLQKKLVLVARGQNNVIKYEPELRLPLPVEV